MGTMDSLISAIGSNPTIQAGAISEAVNVVLGFRPQIVQGNGYAEIIFTPAQEEVVVSFLSRQLTKAPGPVRIRLQGVAIKTFLKNYWFVLMGPFIGGFLTGRRSKRK